ncbi:MAG: GMC family oxidoreductase [Gemmatimonadota bacterium]
MRRRGARYRGSDEVDFIIVGSGAAGGVMARELSRAGFGIVVLEQGPRLSERDFVHDELAFWFDYRISNHPKRHPQTFRHSADEKAERRFDIPPLLYGRLVGGSSVHFTANYWRFHPIDFIERSVLGEIPGTGFADWPLTYEKLEPYYTKVDWEVGVSGEAGVNPLEPPRSRPYPMPPLPVKSSGVLFEKGCEALGFHSYPAPMAITSQPYRGRSGCVHCGFCMGFGCEVRAKSSSLVTMIPEAEETGRCEVRPQSTVFRIETNPAGRVTGVTYFDREGNERFQRAKAVVLCANGAETPRLLLLSDSSRFADGLANSSGLVGRYLMPNGQALVGATFEHELNEYKSVQVTRVMQDFYDADSKRGFYGGGGIDARLFYHPILHAIGGNGPDAPWWGAEYKELLREYPRRMYAQVHTTSLPLETNNVTLDPEVKDEFGIPAIRVTLRDHPDDVAMVSFLQDRAVEILEAAGARKVWKYPFEATTVAAHLLGTCRMGDDPGGSVVDRYHRVHDIPNLFVCDGSSFVTSGRGQPTMTIQALAFRAAEHIAEFARRGEI